MEWDKMGLMKWRMLWQWNQDRGGRRNYGLQRVTSLQYFLCILHCTALHGAIDCVNDETMRQPVGSPPSPFFLGTWGEGGFAGLQIPIAMYARNSCVRMILSLAFASFPFAHDIRCSRNRMEYYYCTAPGSWCLLTSIFPFEAIDLGF